MPLADPVLADAEALAAEVLDLMGAAGLTLATAESLTGGLLGATVTSVPGASAVYVGGAVTYATALKTGLLDVPAAVVEEHGVVSAACADAMARGVRRLCGADLGLSTTGVAGPDRQEDKPAGLVYVAVSTPESTVVRELRLAGGRTAVRHAAVRETLALARSILAEAGDAPGDVGGDR